MSLYGWAVEASDTDQLDAVVDVLRRILGDAVVGMYLYGSAVRGGLRSRSDLDVLVVVDGQLSLDQRRSLTAELLDVSVQPDSGGRGRPIEVTVLRAGGHRQRASDRGC